MGNDHTSSHQLVTSAASGHIINLRAYLAGHYTLPWAAQPDEPQPIRPKTDPKSAWDGVGLFFLDPCRNSTGGYPFVSFIPF